MKKTTRRIGQIVWRDLMTTDLGASKRFYTKLLGWEAVDDDRGELGVLCALTASGSPVARFVPLDASFGFPSHWVSYVSVEDVEAACELAPELGGACCYPAIDDGELGTFAMLEDPEKALTKPFRASAEDPASDGAAGQFVWDQLLADDPERAARFYEGLYGWRREKAPDVFELEGEGVASLGPAIEGASGWIPFVHVESVAAAVVHAKKLKAKVVQGPVDLAGVGKAAIVTDPSGARLGLLEPVASLLKKPPSRAAKKPVKRAPAKVAAGPSPTPRELFARIPERFDAAKAKGLRGIVQYELAGEHGGSWHLVFNDGTCEVRAGVHDAPTVTMSLALSDYVELAFGRMTGVSAFGSGKLKVEGDSSLAMKLGRVLRPLR